METVATYKMLESIKLHGITPPQLHLYNAAIIQNSLLLPVTESGQFGSQFAKTRSKFLLWIYDISCKLHKNVSFNKWCATELTIWLCNGNSNVNIWSLGNIQLVTFPPIPSQIKVLHMQQDWSQYHMFHHCVFNKFKKLGNVYTVKQFKHVQSVASIFIPWILTFNALLKEKLNSMAWLRERTIQTERPPLVGEVSANFCW
jgi:hypothetical protein